MARALSQLRQLHLPTSIFNVSLITALHNAWFADLPLAATAPTEQVMGIWYGLGRTPEQKAALDSELRTKFKDALEALSPLSYPLPNFENYKVDRQNAETMSMPFRKLDGLNSMDEEERSRTGVGLILLLDQVSRNIFRDVKGQELVYGHYDRLARCLSWTILHSTVVAGGDMVARLQGLDNMGAIAHSAARRIWYYMPLMHSEDGKDHDLFVTRVGKLKDQFAAVGDEGASSFLTSSLSFEQKHRAIIDRFGRYPYRNEALGRNNTEEEMQYLEEGGERFSG